MKLPISRGTFQLLRAGALVAGMAVIALAPSTGEASGKSCATKDFKVAKVAQACKEGGQKAATALMKKVVKDQNKAGNKITCESCHSDLDSFERTPNAVADLQKYLK